MTSIKPTYQELERQNRDLKQVGNRFDMLLQASDDMITIHKPNGKYTYYNGPTCYAITPEDIVGKMPSDIFDEDATKVLLDAFEKVLETGVSETIEVLLDWLGEKRWFSEYIYPVKDANGVVVEMVKVCRDIHERKTAEQEIISQNKLLRERDTLLKEVHHRVKNNMQVITSLLRLQAVDFTDKILLSKFREAESRISSMALIHEKMYNSDNLSEINFAEYLTDLLNTIATSYTTTGTKINIEFEVEKVFINMEDAIPCGLIFNEILTNVFKYAFTDKSDGIVWLNLSEREGEIDLRVTDNGVGFDTSVKTETLGMRLIESLTEQLDGESKITSSEAGTVFNLVFARK